MKHISALLIFFVSCSFLQAQSMKVQGAISDLRNDRLDKAKANIDQAAVHESTKDDAKTWYYRAAIYSEIAMTTKEKFKALCPNPLEVAFEAAKKCAELDKSNEFAVNNFNNFRRIAIMYFDTAIDRYQKADYKEAYRYFNEVIINSSLIGDKKANDVATLEGAHVNAALAAVLLNDTAGAKQQYLALVNLNTAEIKPYTSLYQIYKAEKDTNRATRLAERIAKKFKTNFASYINLADLYLWVGDKDKAKAVLDSAIVLSPNNDLVYSAIATLYEQTGNFEEAKNNYLNSLKIKPDQFTANYYLGVLMFNRAVDLLESSNNPELDMKDQLVLYNEGKEFFTLAIPYFETALKYKENDYETLNALKQIYGRIENQEKFMEVSAKLKELRQ